MKKKVAVLAVNPVNGIGLFEYLESFFENGISFKTFAVADTVDIKTNSGILIKTDSTVSELKGHEDDYDAVVFACGDAMPVFGDNADKKYNRDMMDVMKAFDEKGGIIAGHCAVALVFNRANIASGRKIALHPYVKGLNIIKDCIPTDEPYCVDGNIYTAQTEKTLHLLMPELLKALK
ncbi:MAG: DJ-1/PfpI family protein [Bacteroidales bacterium]|jgi:putative intracellular protease/amidase|nr:DJ-1/PfpI family protein [Bacteroidales bacterium]